jgi:signal transduction histidine kinase
VICLDGDDGSGISIEYKERIFKRSFSKRASIKFPIPRK